MWIQISKPKCYRSKSLVFIYLKMMKIMKGGPVRYIRKHIPNWVRIVVQVKMFSIDTLIVFDDSILHFFIQTLQHIKSLNPRDCYIPKTYKKLRNKRFSGLTLPKLVHHLTSTYSETLGQRYYFSMGWLTMGFSAYCFSLCLSKI